MHTHTHTVTFTQRGAQQTNKNMFDDFKQDIPVHLHCFSAFLYGCILQRHRMRCVFGRFNGIYTTAYLSDSRNTLPNDLAKKASNGNRKDHSLLLTTQQQNNNAMESEGNGNEIA